MRRNKVLLINTQFVELYISGFTNRFVGLWSYAVKKSLPESHGEIHWLTNYSLWTKFFPAKKVPHGVTIINANLRFFKFTSRLFYPFYIIYIYYKKKCTSIHVATSIVDSLYLVRLFNLFRIPHCFTFASNSLEMASYNSDTVRRSWQKLFRLAKNIDILNPTNSLGKIHAVKHISPSSFPYFVELSEISTARFVNPQRTNTIVFCGSLIPQKNPLLAFEAFLLFLERFGDKFPDAKLLIIGKGHLQSHLEGEIVRINKAYNRTAVELISDKYLLEVLSTSKLFLSLQDYDNYPSQSLMEAMTFCNSIISFNNGDTKRLVVQDFNNILLEKKSAEQLALAINQVLSSWNLNLDNLNHIQKKFSPKVFADYFFSLHRSISQ